jgi:hypothetical protein
MGSHASLDRADTHNQTLTPEPLNPLRRTQKARLEPTASGGARRVVSEDVRIEWNRRFVRSALLASVGGRRCSLAMRKQAYQRHYRRERRCGRRTKEELWSWQSVPETQRRRVIRSPFASTIPAGLESGRSDRRNSQSMSVKMHPHQRFWSDISSRVWRLSLNLCTLSN